MTITEWVTLQLRQGWKVYMIVAPEHEQQPLISYASSTNGEASPLLNDDQFENAHQYGPWLLPVTLNDITWLANASDSGIVVATEMPLTVTRQHFAALFEAGFGGEIVLFPFYRPDFIAPMLQKMSEDELSTLLNRHNLGFCYLGQWVHYSDSCQAEPHTPQTSPWWQIQPHHLDTTENLPLITANLKSWLWQQFPEAMDHHLKQGREINSLISPYLAAVEHSLTCRVMRAAMVAINGAEALQAPDTVSLLEEYQNEEVLCGLHALAGKQQQERLL